jgi:hypothetical protein
MHLKRRPAVIGWVAAVVATVAWAQDAGRRPEAHQLYAAGQKDAARDLLLDQIKAGHTDVLSDYEIYKNWFCRPDAAELLVKTLEELPLDRRYVAKGDFWLNGARLILQLPVADCLPAQALEMRELLGRTLRVADRFSGVVSDGGGPMGQNRPYLNELARVLIGLQRYQDAYDLLWQAIFGDPASNLPRADWGTLFFVYEWDTRLAVRPLYYPATQLAWLAHRMDKLDDLRRAIAASRQAEPAWDDIGLRLLALTEIEAGDDDAADAALREIASRGPPLAENGFDSSLDIMAEQAARRPALVMWEHTLLAKLIDQIGTSATAPLAATQIIDLARAYLAAGDKEKTAATLAHAAKMLPPRGWAETGADDTLQLVAVDVWADAGFWRETVDGYRALVKRPFATDPADARPWTDLHRLRSRAAWDMRQALQELDREGELGTLVRQVQGEWEQMRPRPPGQRDCEPLVLLASCEMLRGHYAEATAALQGLDDQDYPASLALLFECLAASPQPSEGLPACERTLLRWPYLYWDQGADWTAVYLDAQRPLPLGAPLNPYVDALLASGANAVGEPGGPPSRAKQRKYTQQVLQDMLEQYFMQQGPDARYAAWVEWLWRRFGVQDYAYPWLAWLVEEDPARGYETACKLLALDAQPEDSFAPLTLDRVFEPARELRWLKFDPYGLEEYREPPKTVALVIIEAARRCGRLVEFVDRCENVFRSLPTTGSTPQDARRRELAVRLQLHALTLLDPARAATMLPAFLAGDERFARARGLTGDPALATIREACWHVPELQSAALQIAHQQLELDRQAVSVKRSANLQKVTWPDYTLRYRVAEMELAGGHTAAGLDIVREIIRDMLANVDESLAQSGLDLSGARPVALRMLARKFGLQREALQMLQELRASVPDHPRLCRQFELVENDLRDDWGEKVPPGIVLAVQPAPRGRLQFVWQINRRTLPTPPEALVDEKSAEFQPPVRCAQFVKFWEPERAVSPDGYEVRLEVSFDGRAFQLLWTGWARGTQAPQAGASALELDVEPGVLHWYRARLMRDSQVVATSATLAGISGDNLVAAPTFNPGDASGELVGDGWCYKYGAGGRARPARFARPGSDEFLGTHSLRRYQNARLYSLRVLPLPADKTYVLSCWAVALPDDLVERPAPRGGQPQEPSVWGRLELLFRDDRDAALERAELKFNHTGAAVFGQMLLTPTPDGPPQEAGNWLSWYEGSGAGEGARLAKRTGGLRFWMYLDNTSGLGDFYLEQAKPRATDQQPAPARPQ